MKLWCKVMAAFLALLWLPVSSHCLLEIAELIHHDHCCQPAFGHDHSHGHDAADGNCQVESRQMTVQKQDLSKSRTCPKRVCYSPCLSRLSFLP